MKVKAFLLSVIIISCSEHRAGSEYKIAFRNDGEGKTLMGSKANLVDAIRGGASVRIGWGFKGKSHSIEHLSEPVWLAILDEKEVIAHLDPQVLSHIDWEGLKADYADSSLLSQEWRVVLSTKGEFDAVWYDRKDNVLLQRKPQNHTMTWFVKDQIEDAPPLFRNH